jgi:two-component system LytT family response regulator
MIKAIVIDDEPLARVLVKEYLQAYPGIAVVAECNDGFEGVKAISAHQPDLLFLDIQMPKINGFEMLELLDVMPAVIFTTAFDEYAIRAFEANAVDYLLKPFSKERFDRAVQKWLNTKQNTLTGEFLDSVSKHPDENRRIVVKDGSKIQIIPSTDIFYLEAYDDYVKIHTKDGFRLKKKTMNYYEQTLDSGDFLRVHRSFIINLQCITRIEAVDKNNHMARLKNNAGVPLSRQGYMKLKEVLGV